MARRERYLVGLDVGTSKIAAIVGEIMEGGGLDIIGIGLADSRGIRRGVVVNLEAAVDAIKKALEEAELTAGVEIDSVHLGLSGAHVKGFNSRGVVAVGRANGEIQEVDVDRAPVPAHRYRRDVPVLVAGERELARHRVTAERLRAMLDARPAGHQDA